MGAEQGPGGTGGASALDDLLWSLASDGRSLYGVLDAQPLDRGFLARATAVGARPEIDARELLVDFSAQVRSEALASMSGGRAGFPSAEAAGLLDKVGHASQAAMVDLLSAAANGRRGSVPRDVSVAEALAYMFLDGYLLANHPAPGQRLAGAERGQARSLAELRFGEDGKPASDIWAGELGCGPAHAWEAPSGGPGPSTEEDGELRAQLAEARAEALERELADERARASKLEAAAREGRELLEVLASSGNLSFETASDAVAFAAEALPGRLAFSREALADAAAHDGDADEVWAALRAIAFDFQPEAALGRPPVAGFARRTGFDLSTAAGAAQSPSFTGRIGRLESEAGYLLEGPERLRVYFSVLSDGRIGIVRCGRRRAAHGADGSGEGRGAEPLDERKRT